MKKFRRWWKRLFATTAMQPVQVARAATPLAPRKGLKVSPSAVALSAHVYGGQPVEAFTVPAPHPGVVQRTATVDGAPLLAMDDMSGLDGSYAQAAYQSFFKEGLGFLGYPYLAELSQRAEYRRPVEIIAKEMTRKWIKFTASGSGDKTDKIKLIEADFKKFAVKELFRKAAEGDGYQGRHHLAINTGDNDNPQELMRPLIVDPRKYQPGFLKGFTSVEAIWVYPAAFNATDPLERDYYRPPTWFVQGKGVNTTRLLTFVSRPLPDILKPAYAFGGLALTQIMKPYVDNWLETRQSVNDLIQMFSQGVLKTDMQAVLEGDGSDDLYRRADMFNRTRSNRGIMLLDKDAEEFENVAAPLSGLDKLQAQAQEHMAAACGIPLVVLLGVTPSGLNASSDGEIRTFYQWIKDVQEQLFLPNLTIVLQLVQLNLFGEIDPAIGIEFEPLWEDDAATKATTDKTRADTAQVYITAGVIDPEEERQRLAADETSMYQGVDLSGPPPEPPVDPADEGDPNDDEDDGDPMDGEKDAA